MTTIVRSALLVATALACTALAAPADAASNRTFVSGLGNDANPCTIAQPCRTLQGAFNATAVNGEIEVLDPAGYGALKITHGVSIQGHGWASMNTTVGGVVITINVGANDKVSLRGLVVEGFGSTSIGIDYLGGNALTITDCVVRNFATGGIVIEPRTSSLHYTIANTQVLDNQDNGIFVQPFEGKTDGTLTGVIANNNLGAGIGMNTAIGPGGPSTMTVLSSTADQNGVGFVVAGANAQMLVRDSSATSNGVGFEVDQGATMRVTRSVATGNTQGFGPGAISSYGDNDIQGNTSDVNGTITPLPTR